MSLLELIMADAPIVKVKIVKERKGREKSREKRKSGTVGRSRGQRATNPRRR